VSGKARLGADRKTSTLHAPAARSTMSVRSPLGASPLDQLLAEPIVQQLMRCDQTDEATVRHLVQEIALSRPAPDDPNNDAPNEIVRLLEEISRLWRRLHDRELRKRIPGMTHARSIVLIHLALLVGHNQVALAQTLDIRPSTLARLLDRLEAAGFVARTPDPDDRRAHILTVTAKALPIIESINDLTRKTDVELQLGISKAEAKQLRALLCRIWSNLKSRLDEASSSEGIRTRRHT
jgi:MarR family transcriptional regulator, transcriptional regulator for hemolysin